jgi:2-hydroxy-6-oxonona-2,4-dienedioate hydrolase
MSAVASLRGATPFDGSIDGLIPKFREVAGIRTRYYELGKGAPMVLVHGGAFAGPTNANSWTKNIRGLATRFHVFALDRLACGMTGIPGNDSDYNFQGEVDFLDKFVQAIGGGPVNLVGHSMGGALAFFYAVEHPEEVNSLTIIGAGPEDPPVAEGPTRMEVARAKCPAESTDEGFNCRVMISAWLPSVFDDEYWQVGTKIARDQKFEDVRLKLSHGAGEPLRTTGFSNWRDQLFDRVRIDGVLQMPVLIYAGKQDVLDWAEHDPVARLQRQTGLFEIITKRNPRAQMIVVNNAGHFVYREYPDRFNEDLISFIRYWEQHDAPSLSSGPRLLNRSNEKGLR